MFSQTKVTVTDNRRKEVAYRSKPDLQQQHVRRVTLIRPMTDDSHPISCDRGRGLVFENIGACRASYGHLSFASDFMFFIRPTRVSSENITVVM